MCVDSKTEVNVKEILNQSICPPFFALPEKRERLRIAESWSRAGPKVSE